MQSRNAELIRKHAAPGRIGLCGTEGVYFATIFRDFDSPAPGK